MHEALNRLYIEGFIKKYPNQGMFISGSIS